jgi:hypothetical protein
MKRAPLILALAVLAGLPLAAQTVVPQAKAPVVDGAILPGEYAWTTGYAGMNFSAALSADGSTLYLALEAPTQGWVSIGLGSMRMNGSYMAIGYDKGGKAVLSEDRGRGVGHSPSGEKKLSSWAIKESGAKTTIEISFPASAFVVQGKLAIIMAYGARDDLTSMHSKYGRFEIAVGK